MELVKERSGEVGWGNISLHLASNGACGSRSSLEDGKTKAKLSGPLSLALGCVGPGRTVLVPGAKRVPELWPWSCLLLSL